MKERGEGGAEFADIDDDSRRLRCSGQSTTACYSSVDRAEEGILGIFDAMGIQGHDDRHARLLFNESGESVFLSSYGRKISLLFYRATIIKEVDPNVAVVV